MKFKLFKLRAFLVALLFLPQVLHPFTSKAQQTQVVKELFVEPATNLLLMSQW